MDLLFAISYFGRWGSKPTVEALNRLQMTAAYAAQTSTMGLSFTTDEAKEMRGDWSRKVPSAKSQEAKWKPSPQKQWNFDVFPDATYQTGKETSMSGYVVTLNHMVIAARSGRQRRQAHSSTRAELLSLYDATDCTLAVRLLLLELCILPEDIGVTVWCDNFNAVANVRSVNPRCTEMCSEVLARQLRDVFMNGHTEDTFRQTFPRAAELLEGTAAVEDVLVLNVGEGTFERFTPPTIKTDQLIIPEDDAVQHTSIASRMQDGNMSIIHIDGTNQLGDAMTKSNVDINYMGIIMHKLEDFVENKASPIIEDNEGQRPHYRKKVQEIKLLQFVDADEWGALTYVSG